MRVEIYGKQGCTLCKSACKKVEHFLAQKGLEDGVQVKFMDMETEEGAAEGDFFDVFQIPTVLLIEDEGPPLARWDGKAPASRELEAYLPPGDAHVSAA